jgi:hypothetical protein
MSSSAKEATGSADSEEVDSNSVSSKPKEDDKKPRAKKKKGSDTSYTTNDPSSSSAMATVGTTVAASQPTSQPGLSTLATAAAAAAPPVSLSEKKPRRAGFREQFLQKVRNMEKSSIATHVSVHQPTLTISFRLNAPPST